MEKDFKAPTDPKAAFILKKRDVLKSENMQWNNTWDAIIKYFLPKRDNVYGQQTQGEEKNTRLYDSTPMHANVLLASALHSMLTNPTLMWFAMTTGINELDKDGEIRDWLQKVAFIMHSTFNASNFQTQVHENYLDLPSIGTSVLYIEEDDITDLRFLAKPIFEVFIDENNKGIVDTVIREFKFTLRQIEKEYGIDAIPKEMHRVITTCDEKFTIVHAILPRTDLFLNKDIPNGSVKKMPIASIHIFEKTGTIIRESGYQEFRVAVPRWSKISGEKLGRSPAFTSLPEARMVNAIMKEVIRSAQMTVRPPTQEPEGQYRPLKMIPGGRNFYKPGTDGIKPINTNPRIDIGFELIQEVRNRIQENFFIDQLQLREGPQMTATEVRKRTEQQLRLLSPILGRLHGEYLKPIIDVSFAILLRKGKFPKMPEKLQRAMGGKDLKITYLSTIAKVQRTSESDNLLLALQDVSPLIEADPTILDNIDGDKAFRHAADLRGIPEEIMVTTESRDKLRDERAKMQQAELEEAKAMEQAKLLQQGQQGQQ